jgi:hypothetical protein
MSAGRKINSQSRDWGTPPHYVAAVTAFFGGSIALDPCSNRHSLVRAGVEYRLPKNDGLKQSWNFPTIYVNPPYGADRRRGTTIRHWLARCEQAHREYHAEVIALVPVATNTRHWKQHVFGQAAAICFLYDTRLRFLVAGKEAGKGAPMACAFIYWGKKYPAFFRAFLPCGAVVNLKNLQTKKIGGL